MGASLIILGLFLINKNMEEPNYGDISASKEASNIGENEKKCS